MSREGFAVITILSKYILEAIVKFMKNKFENLEKT
jgi:flagellar biosynthesis protein FliQ